MFVEDANFTELIRLEDWQSIQDSLSEALGVAVSTFSISGALIARSRYHFWLYAEILPRISKQFDCCVNFLFESTLKNLKDIKTETHLKGMFGLDIFIVPIRTVGEEIVSYLVLGPIILSKRKDISEYAQEAGKLDIELEELKDALLEINVFSYNKIRAIIKLAEDVFSNITKTAYHKKRLAEIMPQVIESDPLFARYYEEKVLTSLLNCCMLALGADSGSVMKLNGKTDILHIKVSSKLDEKAVNNSEVKLGEGIAGLAAANAESIILPKDMDKNGLSKNMKRQYIKSSLIMPFNKRNTRDLYGVINLNIIRKNIEFSENDITLVRELVNMASIALSSLKESDIDL